MKLGLRIFICYTIIFGVCFYYPINWVLETLRTRYLEGVEDPLVDQANIFAALVEQELARGRFEPQHWHDAFDNVSNRKPQAQIYQILKNRVDARIYITDPSGVVVFDSRDNGAETQDYSQWRDVALTLQGQYGARTTLSDPEDPTSSVLYVAAPITIDGQLAGVLTVTKPTTAVKNFLGHAKPQIFKIVAISTSAAIALGLLVSFLLTRPIKRLTDYAHDVSNGKTRPFPRLDNSEIGQMGKAFQRMQVALEGKHYVEEYVQNLTHEIKSPLSAIRGAAELLDEKMPLDRQARFLANIHSEAGRIQNIIDRMLALSALENLKVPPRAERVSLHTIVNTVIESKQPLLDQKGIEVIPKVVAEIYMAGDAFLLHQALSNLMQNAIDFSHPNGRISISAQKVATIIEITVSDQGSGIPAYALDKVYDKFYSLQRPNGGKKSTGLGLNFTKAVATLHNGSLIIENNPQGGVCATLTIPV